MMQGGMAKRVRQGLTIGGGTVAYSSDSSMMALLGGCIAGGFGEMGDAFNDNGEGSEGVADTGECADADADTGTSDNSDDDLGTCPTGDGDDTGDPE